MTSAISRGVATRPSAVVAPTCDAPSSPMVARTMSVRVGPGAIALTRTPDGLSSAAQVRVSDSIAALLAL